MRLRCCKSRPNAAKAHLHEIASPSASALDLNRHLFPTPTTGQQPQNVEDPAPTRSRIHNLHATRLITAILLSTAQFTIAALAPRCEPACARPGEHDVESDARVKDNAQSHVEITITITPTNEIKSKVTSES